MASLLIIGGSGFFGKSILDCYRRGLLNCFNITAITVMARNADKLLVDAPDLLHNSIRLLNADIAKCTALPFADIVIHAAASTDERNYLARAEEERVNIQAGTYNFCKLALQFCKDAQIVYVSSGAAYGQQPEGLAQLMEEFAFGPIDQLPSQKRDYAAAKRDGELAIQQLGKEGLRVSIARCFAFLGEYLPRDQHFAIGNFIEDGLNRRPIVVKANHIVYRSYMYSDDLVLWLMAIVKNSSQACPIYNVGSDESISILELARKIGCYLNVDVNAPRVISRVVERYVPSIEKAKMSLGLSLKYDLEESIKLTILKIQSSFK